MGAWRSRSEGPMLHRAGLEQFFRRRRYRMIRNGVRAGWAVLAMLMVLLAPVAGGAVVTHLFSAGSVRAMESASAGRRPLTEEEGQRVAEAALAYAQFEFESAGAMYTGMP